MTQFDSWLLLNYPRVWATRVHYLLSAWFVLIAIAAVLGRFILPVRAVKDDESILARFNNFYYQSIGSESVVLLSIFVFVMLFLWLLRFRSTIRVFKYWEALATILLAYLISILSFYSINAYNVGRGYKMANLYDKKEIQNDLILSKLLSEVNDNTAHITDMKDVTVGNRILTADECQNIKKNINFLYFLDNYGLGKYVMNKDTVYENTTYEETRSLEAERNKRYERLRAKAIKEEAPVPDSLKNIYLSYLVENNFIKRQDIQTIVNNQLLKISPNLSYLQQKYKNAFVSQTQSELRSYFALQNANFISRFGNYNNFDFSVLVEEKHYDKSNDEGYSRNDYNTFSITQDRTSHLQQDFDNYKSGKGWLSIFELLSPVLYFLAILILFLIFFGIKESLLASVGYLLIFLLAGSFILLFKDTFSDSNKFLILITLLIFAHTVLVYILGFTASKYHKYTRLFVPMLIFMGIFNLFYINTYLEYWHYEQHPYRDVPPPNWHWYFNPYILYAVYTVFVIPFLLILYSRLVNLPKAK